MVHPTELLRSDSTGGEGSFVAPITDYQKDIDCGCSALPCLNEGLNLEKYAKPGYFVGVLSTVAFLSGITVKYFRGTSQIWSHHYNISEDTVDWLAYINEVFVGLFALVLAYWGNRIHRAHWLGALTIYFGVSCIIISIPEIYQPFKQDETDVGVINGRILCQLTRSSAATNFSMKLNSQIVPLVIIILFQVVFAFFTISFVTHGISYIDDNLSPSQSPAYIALVFAAQRVGKQTGIYSAWVPLMFSTQSVFISAVWLVVAVQIVIFGCLLAMFPKVMPNTLLRKSVDSLLNIASGNNVVESEQVIDGYFQSLWRILKNKVLLLSISAMTFIQAAVINFTIKEKHFNQVKYHVSRYKDPSGYSDPTLMQFTTNLLKQPFIAMSYICVGMLIAKIKPRGRYLVYWNIKIFAVVLLGFAGIRFFSCTNKMKNEISETLITIPYCSWNCGCFLDGPFQPVCLNGETHFSPCWAGCTSFDTSLKIYDNCTCGGHSRRVAAEGSCDADECSTLWALAQVHSVFASAFIGTTFITSFIICLRSVVRKDKALAIGLYLTSVSLVSYLPIRAIYDVIANNFCYLWGRQACQYYSNNSTLYISIITLILKGLAIIASIVLLFFIDKIDLYNDNHTSRSSVENISVLRRANIGDVYQNSDSTRRNNHPDTDEGIASSSESPDEATALLDSLRDALLRNKQQSESKLENMLDSASREDSIFSYLSERDLVPPLETNLKLGKSTPRTSNSNNSVLSDSSLSAIANMVGDDHDSDVSTLQGPERFRNFEHKTRNNIEMETEFAGSIPESKPEISQNNILETEF